MNQTYITIKLGYVIKRCLVETNVGDVQNFRHHLRKLRMNIGQGYNADIC